MYYTMSGRKHGVSIENLFHVVIALLNVYDHSSYTLTASNPSFIDILAPTYSSRLKSETLMANVICRLYYSDEYLKCFELG